LKNRKRENTRGDKRGKSVGKCGAKWEQKGGRPGSVRISRYPVSEHLTGETAGCKRPLFPDGLGKLRQPCNASRLPQVTQVSDNEKECPRLTQKVFGQKNAVELT
jgi:hypothetical protein